MRKEDDRRKRRRAEKAARLAAQEEERAAEMRRLKNLKKEEVNARCVGRPERCAIVLLVLARAVTRPPLPALQNSHRQHPCSCSTG